MNAETILANINKIAAQHEIIKITKEYEMLVQGLKEEIALKEQKKSGKPNRFKAALRFAKYCNGMFKNTRPLFAGAFMDNGMQYITDAIRIVRFETPFDGLPQGGEGIKPASLTQLFKYNSSLPVTLPPLAELKTKLKIAKADGTLDSEGRDVVEIGGRWFNTEYVIQLIEMVEPTEAYFSREGNYPLLVLIGDGAQGALSAMKIKGKEA